MCVVHSIRGIRPGQLSVDDRLHATKLAALALRIDQARAAAVTTSRHHIVVVQSGVASVRVFFILSFETLLLQFVMTHQLISSAVVGVSFIQNVLTDLIEVLAYVWIKLEELVDDRVVDLIVLVIYLLLVDVVQVFRQILLVPNMLLDLLQRNSFDRVGLKHAIYQVLYGWGQVLRDEVTAFFDLTEKLRHVVVIERQATTDHGV